MDHLVHLSIHVLFLGCGRDELRAFNAMVQFIDADRTGKQPNHTLEIASAVVCSDPPKTSSILASTMLASARHHGHPGLMYRLQLPVANSCKEQVVRT